MEQSLRHKTAILVFANSSQEELKRKTILNGRALFDALTEQALVTVVKTGLPFFHFTEKQQVGDTFGERFANAISAVFQKGYDQVITVGNDSPQLRSSHILTAEKQLSTNKFVLGPSVDGGFYLMGIHHSQFDPLAFKNLAWQTSVLSKQLLDRISKLSIHVFKLPALIDIDTAKDIKSLVTYTFQLPEKLWVILLKLFQPKEQIIFNHLLFVPELCAKTYYNKGSPLNSSL